MTILVNNLATNSDNNLYFDTSFLKMSINTLFIQHTSIKCLSFKIDSAVLDHWFIDGIDEWLGEWMCDRHMSRWIHSCHIKVIKVNHWQLVFLNVCMWNHETCQVKVAQLNIKCPKCIQQDIGGLEKFHNEYTLQSRGYGIVSGPGKRVNMFLFLFK